MSYDIDEKIIKSAVKCDKDYICLSGEGGVYCKPTDIMRGTSSDIALVECSKDKKTCPYWQSFESTAVCLCPVRVEIYRRYER